MRIVRGDGQGPPGLTPREEAFARAYVLSLDPFVAARAAGYANATVQAEAYLILKRPRVLARIKELKDGSARQTAVDADSVLSEMMAIAKFDPLEIIDDRGAVKPMSEMTETARRSIASLEVSEIFEGVGQNRVRVGELKKVRFWPKDRALEMLARHLGLLVEKSLNIDVSKLTDDQLKRIASGEDPFAVVLDTA